MKKYFYLGLGFFILCFLVLSFSGCKMRKYGGLTDVYADYAVFNFKDADGFLSKEDFEKLEIITVDLKRKRKEVWMPEKYPVPEQIDSTQCKVSFAMLYYGAIGFHSCEDLMNNLQVKIISDKYKTKEINPLSSIPYKKIADKYSDIYYFDEIILEKR